jgi:hypothetical protein
MKERCNDLAVWIDPPDQWNKLVRKLRWMGWEDEARWLQIAAAIGKQGPNPPSSALIPGVSAVLGRRSKINQNARLTAMQTVCVSTRHCYRKSRPASSRLRLREHYCCGIGRTSWRSLHLLSRLEA